MATITINGVQYVGGNVEFKGNQIIIDGVTQENTKGPFEVRVLEGAINYLTADGSVNCSQVNGNVNAGGSVNCDDVGGSVTCGGSVNCDNVEGDINASGSVRTG